MKECLGDLWTYDADVRVIPTNLEVRQDGRAVMGKGVALEAAQRYPGIAQQHAELLRRHGARVFCIWEHADAWEFIYNFPTKYYWRSPADPALIRRSAQQLWDAVNKFEIEYGLAKARIVMPRVGCGEGGLDWERHVKPLIRDILDDRFIVVHQVG